MHTLLVYGALMDEVSSLVVEIEAESVGLLFLFYGFLFLSSLTILNMLIGVICEMVLTVGETEREIGTMNFVTEKIEELLAPGGVDENDDNLISKAEFMKMLSNKKAASILHEVGVDVVGLVDFADTIFEPEPHEEDAEEEEYVERQLTFHEFMRVVLDLRGSKTARVKDVVNLRKHINGRFARLEQRLVDKDVITRSRSCMRFSKQATSDFSFLHAKTSGSTEECQPKQLQEVLQDHSPLSTAGTTEKRFLDAAGSFLRDLQVEHERELAGLHVQNLQLLERLSSVSPTKSLSAADVGQVAQQATPNLLSEVVSRSGTSQSGEATWFWAKPPDNDVEPYAPPPTPALPRVPGVQTGARRLDWGTGPVNCMEQAQRLSGHEQNILSQAALEQSGITQVHLSPERRRNGISQVQQRSNRFQKGKSQALSWSTPRGVFMLDRVDTA